MIHVLTNDFNLEKYLAEMAPEKASEMPFSLKVCEFDEPPQVQEPLPERHFPLAETMVGLALASVGVAAAVFLSS
jgi:hypothetical protein